MGRAAFCIVAFALSFLPAQAVVYSGSGTVYLLRSHASVVGTDKDWFSLVNVTSLGVCKTADAGYVVLRLRDDVKGQRMFSLVLAAKAAGTTVTVVVDDAVVDAGGYCYASSVE
jgi:hypothetical protein